MPSEARRIAVEPLGEYVLVTFPGMTLIWEFEMVDQIGNELYALVERDGAMRVIVSFRGVELAGSMMLGKLISLQRRMEDRHGKLRISELNENMHNVFRPLKRIFDIYETAEEAAGLIQPKTEKSA
jgi:anti-sigma B factor antagonist